MPKYKINSSDYEQLFNFAPGLFLVLDPSLTIVAVTEGYLRATMTKRDEIVGRGIFEVFPDNPDDPGATGVANLRASLQSVLEGKRPNAMAVQKYDIARPIEAGGGFEERYWSPLNSPILGPDGDVRFIIHRVEDVTALMQANLLSKQQEERTRELEHEILRTAGEHEAMSKLLRAAQSAKQHYESLLDSIGGVVWEADPGEAREVTNTYVSKLAIERTGYARQHWTKRFWHEHVHPEDRAVLERRREIPSAGGELSLEFRIIAADGHELWMRERVAVIRNGGKPICQGLVLDITTLRKSEDELRQALKMESIGRLAGGVAHDFNNMLGVIMAQASLISMKLPEGDPLHERIQSIIDTARRSAELTGQLLAFSRQQVLQTRVLNPNTVLTETERMLRKIIGEDIEIVADMAPNLGSVRADPAQLQQVIMNLAVNARDAMPQGGRLLIATSNVHLDEPYISRHSTVTPGDYVLIIVSDTGLGMDSSTQARIFEPFFTTKELGKGTGLGLATVYGIVKQSGGYIWVYSEPGEGTMFKIYLPRVFESVTPQRQTGVKPDLRGTEHILLAEDQQQYRELISEILRDHGYRVLEAANGKTALERVHSGPVDLLLTDVIMPGMNGFELTQSVRRARPDTRVLFMSGYTDDEVSRRGIVQAGDGFLQKPFGPTELLEKVRGVLDRE